MCKHVQLLVLLGCVAGITRVALAGTDNAPAVGNSQGVCCAAKISGNGNNEVGTECVPSLSGTAAEYLSTRQSKVAECNTKYRAENGPGGAILGATCSDNGDCVSDKPGSGGDPHIVALDGRHYLLWGKLDTTYNLLSERNHAINIHLFHPENLADKQALYIDAVGFLIHSARITVRMIHPTPKDAARLELTVGSETTTIAYSGRPVDRAVDPLTSYSFRSPQKVTISSRDIVVSVVIAENYYLNVMVDEVAASWGDVHGVMGQTHASAFKLRYNYARGTAVGDMPSDIYKQKSNRPYQIQGKEDDYIVSGLLKTDDHFSRFVPEPLPVSRKLFNNQATAAFAQKNEARARTVAAVLGA